MIGVCVAGRFGWVWLALVLDGFGFSLEFGVYFAWVGLDCPLALVVVGKALFQVGFGRF